MKTAKHNLSHYKLASLKMGKLYPVGCIEVIQGDTFKHRTDCFLRMAPMNAPIMHPVWVRLHHWFVPYRILWGGFEDFITAKKLNYVAPYFTGNTLYPLSGISDFLGIGVSRGSQSKDNIGINYFPFLAYLKIWAEFYADEQLDSWLIGKVNQLCSDFADKNGKYLAGGRIPYNTNTYGFDLDCIRPVSWFKDYFTTARPSPQLGPDLGVPISPTRGVTGKQIPTIMQYIDGTQSGKTAFVDVLPNRPTTGAYGIGPSTTKTFDGVTVDGVTQNFAPALLSFDGLGNINGIPISSQSVNIRELRAAFALQKIFINRNEYGNRFSEYLAAQGIKYSDRSLQLPQYLGGGKDLLQISEIVNTTSVNSADLYGHGIGSLKTNSYIRYFEEPGIVLSLLSVVPKNVYMNSTPKMFFRRTQEDFFQPELQHLDAQEIKNKEIYSDGSNADNNVWGYQQRYDDFRTCLSSVSGEFRTTLKDWHLAREFGSLPALNSNFIHCNPSPRIFAAQNSDQIYLMAKHKIIARRHLTKRAQVKIV